MWKPVLSTCHVNTSPAPAVVTLNSSLNLHICDVPVPTNMCLPDVHLCKVFSPIPLSADLATTIRSYALIKRLPHFYQKRKMAPWKSAFYGYNYE